MIIGQHLAANTTDQGVQRYYYTPWFPRGGNNGTFTLDVIDASPTASITVTVQTKNSEEVDPGVPIGSLSVPATIAAGQHSSLLAGALELVRFEILVTGDPVADWVHCRMLNVTWQTN